MSEFRDSKIRTLPLSSERRFESSFAALVGREVGERVVDIDARSIAATSEAEVVAQNINIDQIEVRPNQIRERFDQGELEALAQSLVQQGVVQPIVVRPLPSGALELVAGERRLRAAKLAGLFAIPAVVKELTDQQALEAAIVENAQRENLDPVEEARAYERLTKDYGISQGEVARRLGKSRVAIANSIRLLQLPAEILELLHDGAISAGHARALLMLEDPKQQLEYAHRVVMSGLSVRALEKLIAQLSEAKGADALSLETKAQLERLGKKVGELLDLSATVKLDRQGRRRLELVFPTDAAWKRFISRIRD